MLHLTNDVEPEKRFVKMSQRETLSCFQFQIKKKVREGSTSQSSKRQEEPNEGQRA
jgi:hypothetical protein